MLLRKLRTQNDDWFISSVIYPRCIQIMLWVVLLQIVLATTMSILVNFCFPSNQNTKFSKLFTFHVFYSILMLGSLVALFSYFHFNNLTSQPIIPVSHWKLFRYRFSVERLLNFAAFTIIGFAQGLILNRIYASLLADVVKGDNSYWLSSKSIFAAMFAAFCGYSTCLEYYYYRDYCLCFNAVEQLKVISIKSKLKELFWKCLKTLPKTLLVFCFIYFITCITLTYYNLIGGARFNPLSIFAILDAHHHLLVVSCGFNVMLVYRSLIGVAGIFLTESFQFKLDLKNTKDDHKYLSAVIKAKPSSLMGILACKDFSNFTKKGEAERALFYAISIPGGHPYNWNSVCEASLKIIKDFQVSLTNIKPSKIPEPVNQPGQVVSPLNVRNLAQNALPSPIPTYMITGKGVPFAKTLVLTIDQFIVASFNWMVRNLKTTLLELFPKTLMEKLTKEQSDKVQEINFASSQSVIWVIKGLGGVVSYSFKEDKHGVVQWSLSKVLTTLFDLQQTLERCPKVLAKRNPTGNFNRSWQLQQSLKATLSSVLYQIVTTFGSHLNYVELSEEHRMRVEQIYNFIQ